MRARERASIRVGREGSPSDGRLHLYQSVASFIPSHIPSLFISFGWLRCMPITIVFSLRVVSYDCLALAPHGLIEAGAARVYRDLKTHISSPWQMDHEVS